DTPSPADKSAAAQRMSAPRRAAERLAQPSDPRATRLVQGAADRNSHSGEQPFRHFGRRLRHHCGTEKREPCRVQADVARKESVPLLHAGCPRDAQCADLAEQRGGVDLAWRRPVTLPQARPLERGIEVARIAYEGLLLGFEEC